MTITCDECQAEHTGRRTVYTCCESCVEKHNDKVKDLEARIDELEHEAAELQKEIGIQEGQRETEAEVFAAQLREKDVLINKLLEKVHAA